MGGEATHPRPFTPFGGAGLGEGTRIETSGPGPGPGPVKYLDLSILVANRGSVGGSSTMVALLKDALRAAEEAAGKAAAFRPTTESTLERIRAAEEQAEEHGDSVKQSAQADVLMRKWLRLFSHFGAHSRSIVSVIESKA